VPDLAALLADGYGEASAFWIDPETGELCKCRPDWTSPAGGGVILVDGKTCQDASPEGFGRAIWNMDYHLQAAWYRRGERIATGRDVACYLIAVEAKAPHDVGVFRLSDALLDHADRELTGLLRTLRACLDADRWPGRFPEVASMELPDWMIDPDRVESDDEDQEEDSP